MKKQDWIFFDTDKTLFTFDSFTGLQRMFLDFSITFTAEDLQDYQTVNKSLWVGYQNGAIISLQLQHARFQNWAECLKAGSGQLNDAFINAMAEICSPLPGVVFPLNAIRDKTKIGIITSGFTASQQIRPERTGLRDYLDLLVISRQTGAVEPDPRTFDHALEQAGNPDRSRTLMVGGTAESDILGGINVGLSICWLNTHHRKQPAGIQPTWAVASLSELEQLPCKH